MFTRPYQGIRTGCRGGNVFGSTNPVNVILPIRRAKHGLGSRPRAFLPFVKGLPERFPVDISAVQLFPNGRASVRILTNVTDVTGPVMRTMRHFSVIGHATVLPTIEIATVNGR